MFKIICIFVLIFSQSLFSQYGSYAVKKGDTLYGIAFRHNMKISDFLELNGIKSSSKYKLKIGEKLKVEMNDIFTLAYDKKTKSYAMVKVAKSKLNGDGRKDNKIDSNDKVEEKEVIIAKDSIATTEEKTIAAKHNGLSDDLYTVSKGDTLYGIAFKHDMKVSDFLTLNDIKDSSKYNLQIGDKLKVKKEVEKTVEKVQSNEKKSSDVKVITEKTDLYTVSKGDTLYGIAFKHDMKVSDFLTLNDIKDSSKYNLQIGDKLKVKKEVEKTVEKVASSEKKSSDVKVITEKTDLYTVSKGDTLYGIAFKHDIKISDFLTLNDIKDSSKYNLQIGQKLKVKKEVENKTEVAIIKQQDNSIASTKNNSDRLVESYTAKSGDTLSEIAQYFGMDIIDLYIINKMDNKYVLKVGDKLYVYKREATAYNTKKYSVKSGDTLYSIARNNGMNINELLNINNIKDINKYTLHAGTQLKVYTKNKLATDKVANQDDVKSVLASSQKQETITKELPQISLIWPHKGSIVTSYGVQKDKIANRGINISGSKGDKIVAAYKGIIEYSGPIRGFGNVIIIRHENDYTTSYAHLSSSTLEAGDIVEKGDEIGIIGSSGVVDSLELYFKVSYLGMPINPILVLPKS